jgi:hypothetical protein
MNSMAGFFAELYMNSGLFGFDGRGLSKNRISENHAVA